MIDPELQPHLLYETPPLKEVVCEFRFLGDEPWDPTVPGLFYEQVRDRFPTHRPAPSIESSVISTEVSYDSQFASTTRSQFIRSDGSAIVQVGPNLLAINVLHSYSGWDAFRSMIMEMVRSYREIADPSSIQRIGLRYINHFSFPSQPMALQSMFNFYPHLAIEGSKNIGLTDFFVSIHLVYSENRDAMRLQLSDGPGPEPGTITFVLDLEFFLNQQNTVPVDEVEPWLNHAHDEISTVFEATVTEAIRHQF